MRGAVVSPYSPFSNEAFYSLIITFLSPVSTKLRKEDIELPFWRKFSPGGSIRVYAVYIIYNADQFTGSYIWDNLSAIAAKVEHFPEPGGEIIKLPVCCLKCIESIQD